MLADDFTIFDSVEQQWIAIGIMPDGFHVRTKDPNKARVFDREDWYNYWRQTDEDEQRYHMHPVPENDERTEVSNA